MKLFLRHRDTEALMDRQPLADGSGLDDVDAFLTDMRLDFGALPAPEPRPTLAATLDGRRELRPASGPAPKPTFPPARPPAHRLRPVVAVFAASAVLFGGLASAGALPGPVQRTTADLGSHVGLELPGRTPATPVVDGGSDGQPRTGPTEKPAADPSTPTPSTTATTVPVALPTPTVPTVPTVPTLPTTPTVPTTPALPIPHLTPNVPLPAPTSPGLTDWLQQMGVLPTTPSP
jgi:hypothetical protein